MPLGEARLGRIVSTNGSAAHRQEPDPASANRRIRSSMKRIYSIYAPGLAPRDPKQPLEPVEIASCSSFPPLKMLGASTPLVQGDAIVAARNRHRDSNDT